MEKKSNKVDKNGIDAYRHPADVICQHTVDGDVIPIKIRVVDEDGERQTFVVKQYKQLLPTHGYTMPNGVQINSCLNLHFECKIAVFEQMKIIKLSYNDIDKIWRVTF